MQPTSENLLGRASCFRNIICVCASLIYVVRKHFIRVVMCITGAKLFFRTFRIPRRQEKCNAELCSRVMNF